jgi:metal-dependent amidase/aminoacylase/carboxypeptidase family protein
MTEILIAHDAEDIMRQYVARRLADLGDSATVFVPPTPAQWPDRSVYIWRTGGQMINLVVDAVQLTLECRAPTQAQAMTLGLKVAAIMDAATRETQIMGVPAYGGDTGTQPYVDPDPDNTNFARVTLTRWINLRVDTSQSQPGS